MIRTEPCDGIYLGDGEWISWSDFGEAEPDSEYETHLARLEGESDLAHRFPCADTTVLRQFLRLGNAAQEQFEMTGRHLNIYGELGELFAAARYGISLHAKPDAPGSDGRLGNAFMEIKTISPRSTTDRVTVSPWWGIGRIWLSSRLRLNSILRAVSCRESRSGRPAVAFGMSAGRAPLIWPLRRHPCNGLHWRLLGRKTQGRVCVAWGGQPHGQDNRQFLE